MTPRELNQFIQSDKGSVYLHRPVGQALRVTRARSKNGDVEVFCGASVGWLCVGSVHVDGKRVELFAERKTAPGMVGVLAPGYLVLVNDQFDSSHPTIKAAVLRALELYDNATQIKVEVTGEGRTVKHFYQLFFKSTSARFEIPNVANVM